MFGQRGGVFSPLASTSLLISHLLISCHAHGDGTGRRVNSGLIGYGISMYEPYCAFACKTVLSEFRLNCSSPASDHSTKVHTSTDCFASNDAFLQSLAWCMSSHCRQDENLPDWDLEKFWIANAVGDREHQPKPKCSYQDALRNVLVISDSLVESNKSADLQVPVVVMEDEWRKAYSSLQAMAWIETQTSRFGFILLLASILLPLFIACLGLLPSIAAVDGFAASHLLYPALYGKRHAVPLAFNLGLLPTRAQTMFIICMILLNFILSVLGYESTLSNASIFNYTAFEERLEHFANRVGILCFANLPGMILYSSRNNPLIRLTGWPYGTFLLYHRWIAYICVSQASLHSLIWVMLHIHVLPHKFTQPYWIIGTLATICFILVVPSSALFVRRRYYEIFLNLHVLFAISVLAGCYYHITLKFEHQWGYENWIYVAILVWITEKTVRTIKMMKNGLKKAIITQIDEEYTRVDIPDVSATGHAYLYFPTLSWMFWQNHPFSIASSVYEWKEFDVDEKNLSQPDDSVFQLVGSDSGSDTGSDVEDEREEGHMLSDLNTQRQRGGTTLIVPETSMSPEVPHSAMALLPNSFHDNDMTRESLDSHHPARIPERFNTGLTFYIRRHKGITASLNGSNRIDIPVILEAPYQSSSRSVFATYKHVVCIIGGAGISTVLPILHDRASANAGRTVLYWGSRSPSLVREVEVDRLIPAGIEVRVRVGERWDVAGLVRRETRSGSGDVVVFVSGPAGMADDARQAVVQANKLRVKQKRGGLVILVEECFSW